MQEPVTQYNNSQQTPAEIAICNLLAQQICLHLPTADYKIWHAHPVWFLQGNPIVGYSKRKCGINLMFWSGQSFEEPLLKPEGKFKAAEICFTDIKQIKKTHLKRWLQKAQTIQWNYKDIVKRKGVLEKLF